MSSRAALGFVGEAAGIRGEVSTPGPSHPVSIPVPSSTQVLRDAPGATGKQHRLTTNPAGSKPLGPFYTLATRGTTSSPGLDTPMVKAPGLSFAYGLGVWRLFYLGTLDCGHHKWSNMARSHSLSISRAPLPATFHHPQRSPKEDSLPSAWPGLYSGVAFSYVCTLLLPVAVFAFLNHPWVK